MNAVISEADMIGPNTFDRRKGLGASDAAPAVGKSKWCSPYQLFREKLGLASDKELEPIRLPLLMGKALEPLVLDLFTRKSGLESSAMRQARVFDPQAPWRWVSLDAMASDGRPVEAKSAAQSYGSDWGDENEDDAVPMPYYLQCQHSMGCDATWDYVWMPLLVLNRQFRLYRVRRDEEVVQLLRSQEHAFMQHVWSRTPPPPVDIDDVSDIYPTDTKSTLVATADVVAVVQALAQAKTVKKSATENEQGLVLQVKTLMGEYGTLKDPAGNVLCTNKQAKASEKFDTDSFRAAYPALYSQFLKETPGSRRLLVK